MHTSTENIKYPLFLSLSSCAYTNQSIFNSLEGPIVHDKLMSISDQVVSHKTNYPSKGNISKSEATNTTLSTRACMNCRREPNYQSEHKIVLI